MFPASYWVSGKLFRGKLAVKLHGGNFFVGISAPETSRVADFLVF